jgi:hypothetical protein
VRMLDGSARWSAGIAFAAVVVVLAFSGPFLIVPAVVAVAALALQSLKNCNESHFGLAPLPPEACRTSSPASPAR